METIEQVFGGVKNMVKSITRLEPLLQKLDVANLFNSLHTLNEAMTSSALSDPGMITEILNNVADVSNVIGQVVALDKDATAVFQGGVLTVQHNLKKVDMKVNVKIDTKELGKAIVEADLGTRTTPEYIQTSALPTN